MADEKVNGPEIPVEDAAGAQTAAVAGAQAVQAGASAEEVQAIIQKSLDEHTKSLSDSDIEKVADALVKKFEELGAFENPTGGSQESENSSNLSSADSQSASSAESTSTESSSPPPAPPVEESQKPPRKGTLADRFLRE